MLYLNATIIWYCTGHGPCLQQGTGKYGTANTDSHFSARFGMDFGSSQVWHPHLRTAAFEAYCAIWVRRSNFRHQASPRVSPRQSTQQRKVEPWARNVREFCLNANFHVTFRDLLHAAKLQHVTDSFTSPPKEDFFALKIRRLRPGANPRTWVPKAGTLPLDHQSRFIYIYIYITWRIIYGVNIFYRTQFRWSTQHRHIFNARTF